jgi:ribonucleotide reductase class II
MVRELDRVRSGSGSSAEISSQAQQQLDFPATAPTANPVFFRTYSRFTATGRETWQEVCTRTLKGLVKLGKLTDAEADIIDRMQRQVKAMPSGRWLWVGGSEWLEQPQNFSGAYNCTSTNVCDWAAFALMMDLAMMGCGTGAILEPDLIGKLPVIKNKLSIAITSEIGGVPIANRQELSTVEFAGNNATIRVGDSRQGWVNSYKILLELSSDDRFNGEVNVSIDLSNVRPAGEQLKGFGGMANPVRLPELYGRCAGILNKANGRQLNSVECCLLIDEAAVTIVAGNIRRSAGMRQYNSNDTLGSTAKDNLWQQDESGNWRIDPERDSLRMANHTRVFHHKPTLEECVAAVQKQYYSGEGAIQWAGEAVARSNADLLTTTELKANFLKVYAKGKAKEWLENNHPNLDEKEIEHRLSRFGLNPCVTADTWVHTEAGAKQVKELIGIQHGTYINGELFSTTKEGFFYSGTKPVVKMQTKEGYQLRLTANHQVLKVTSQTQKSQYTQWVEAGTLEPGDRVLIHNHRNLVAWDGAGTAETGWLLGSLVGDGCFSTYEANYTAQAKLRFWGDTQVKMQEYALNLVKSNVVCADSLTGIYNRQNKYLEINSAGLRKLAAEFDICHGHKTITPKVESASYDFYCGFLRGLFDADGSVQGTQLKGISVRLAQSNLELLEAVQRMLLRLGIASTIYQNRRDAGMRMLPDSNRELAEYYCQAQHELVIANDNLSTFQSLIGFQEPIKAERLDTLIANYRRNLNRERFTATISEIVPDGEEAVYDCTVPGPARFDANGFVAHNCGEIIGTNFHCVSGDTLLITRDGLSKIKDVIDREVEIWNGKGWSKVTPFQTNTNQKLYRVQFNDGSYLDATEYHRFFVKDRFNKEYQEVLTKDLMDVSRYHIHTEPFQIQYEDGSEIDPSYAYTLGVAVGDGTVDQKNRAKIRLYEGKSDLVVAGHKSPERNYDYLPAFTDVTELDFSAEFLKALKTNPEAFDIIASWNRQAILHFIAGLADTDGSNTHSNGIRIYISDRDRAHRCQLLLAKCGIRCSLNLMSHKGAVTNYGVRSQDLYYLQITNCAEIPCQRLDTSKSTEPTGKGKWQVIRGVEELPGLHDTFCFNEPEFHKGVFGLTLAGNCNLSEIHLNQLDPNNHQEQKDAFTASALSVAALLNHKFQEPRYQYSRELDPIVGVSFTGLFDFFVHAFGSEWLQWWAEGRPATEAGIAYKQKEHEYLNTWREVVEQTVWEYCDRHGIKRPNRCTTVQPSGTKSLLTGASPGWHAPKAQRFIRRITFRKDDPVALACIDYGYSVIPSQSDKDENGNLLDDAYDPRCTEWLIEIPVAVSWADLPGADSIEIGQFSALSQMDFYMGVQQHYVRHNTSATIELREHEVDALGKRIYEAIRDDEGYISAALLARFDDHQTFPRLPFEPIDKATFDEMMVGVLARRQTAEFHTALSRYDLGNKSEESGPAGCDSDKCLLPDVKPNS